MKRKIAGIFVGIWAIVACLCGCGTSFSFPSTAQEEYARVFALYDGQVRNFDAVLTFSATQSVVTAVPELSETVDASGHAVYPIEERRVYWYDARNGDNVLSSSVATLARFASSEPNAVPVQETSRLVYADNILCAPLSDENGNQSSAAIRPIARFASRAAYMQDERSFDRGLQSPAVYAAEWFASLSGSVNADGVTYMMHGEIAPEYYADFFDVFAAQYDFKQWYTGGEDRDGRMYEWFLDPRFLVSAQVDIVTTRDGLSGISVTVRSYASPHPVGGLTQEVTVVAATQYSTEPIGGSIVLPEIAED